MYLQKSHFPALYAGRNFFFAAATFTFSTGSDGTKTTSHVKKKVKGTNAMAPIVQYVAFRYNIGGAAF